MKFSLFICLLFIFHNILAYHVPVIAFQRRIRHLHYLPQSFPSFSTFFSSFHILHAKASHKVKITHEGKTTELVVREDCSILDAALDAGIELPHDCKLGVCLTCPSKLVSGKVDQSGSTLDDSVMEKGFALTCCAFPRSDLEIRSIDEEELLQAQFSDRKTA